MEAPNETPNVLSGASLSQSGEIVLAKFEALTSHGNESGSQIPEQMEEQVLGYLEVQPSEVQLVQDSSTFYLQPQEIEIDGEHLILAQGEEAGEIIVVVSTDQEHSTDQAVAELAQGAVVNATVMHSESGENKPRMFVVNQPNRQFNDRKAVTSPSIKTETGQLSGLLTVEQVTTNVQNDSTKSGLSENILTPKTSKSLSHDKETDLETIKDTSAHSSLSSQEESDRKLMQLACIAHDMEIERSHAVNQAHSTTASEVSTKIYSCETENKASSSVCATQDNELNQSGSVSSDFTRKLESPTEDKSAMSANNASDPKHTLSDKPESISRVLDSSETLSSKSESSVKGAFISSCMESEKPESPVHKVLDCTQMVNEKLESSINEIPHPSHSVNERAESSTKEVLDTTQSEEAELSVNELDSSHLPSDKPESSVDQILDSKQTLDAVGRNRHSMEVAETIAALHHSDRLLHHEDDQSVPSYSNTFPLVENSSSLMPETQSEFCAVSANTSTFPPKGNSMVKESHDMRNGCEAKPKCEVTPSSYVAHTATTEEADASEIKENQIENTVILNSCEDRQVEKASNTAKEPCLKEESNVVGELHFMEESILGSKRANEKIAEIQVTEFPEMDINKEKVLCKDTASEIDKDKQELLCRETTSETSTNKEGAISPPSNQAYSIPLSIFTAADSSSQSLGISNVSAAHSYEKGVPSVNDDLNNYLVAKCTEATNNVSPLKRECLLTSTTVTAKDVDEARKAVNNLNSEVCTFEVNAKEISSSLQDRFSQDVIKSSSSQAASNESVTDSSTDQVVPQIDIASGKSCGTGNMDQSSSDSWLVNKQEECSNFSNVQNIAELEDLHNKEQLKPKVADQMHYLSGDRCMQKDERYHCHAVGDKANTTDIKMQAFDKTCSTNTPTVTGMEERKRVIQTVECTQKPSFMQSVTRPLRSKQPVVIHLRSSISKPSVSDWNKGVSTNKTSPCSSKENSVDKEILSKPTLSEIEGNCVRTQLRTINDNEPTSDVSTMHNNTISTKETSTLETSFVEFQETRYSDPSSVNSGTSPSSVEIYSNQLGAEKISIDDKAKNSIDDTAECLTPKIKKQFQLLISTEKSDAEVNLSSIKSKIHQKLQIDSDETENLKNMDLVCEENLPHVAESKEQLQIQSPLEVTKPSECESFSQLGNEEERFESTLRTRGTKRKSSINSNNKTAKLSDERKELVEEQPIEVEHAKKGGKRKAVADFEKLAKQPRSNLRKETNFKDQIFKSQKSPVQKSWCLRSRSASIREVEDPKVRSDFAATTADITTDQPVSVAVTGSAELPTGKIMDSCTEAEKVHPGSETTKPELLSLPLLEQLAEDSDHSGISEDLLSHPPVLITRNKFLNSTSLLSPKSKRQYIKKHVKSKSATLSVQKVQSPRKYSPRKKSVLPSTGAPRRKHLRTKSESFLTTDLEREEEATVTPLKLCDFRIRYQTPTTPPDKVVNYSCVGCRFQTSRVQNLIHHYRENCSYTGPDAFHWDVDQIEGAKKEDSWKSPKANGCSATKHIIETGRNVVDSAFVTPVKKFHIKSADAMEESIDSDSNSVELPPAFDTPSKKKFGFAEDDVVWVEWKTLHWPALVRKIYAKAKKASIMFIDSPSGKKGIRVPIKKISTFNNAERNKKFLSEGRAATAHSDSLVKAVQKAEDFLRKRCLGINISAAQFFGNLEEFPECTSDIGSSTGTPSEPGDISHDCHLSDISSNLSFPPILRTDEEPSKQLEDSEDKCEASVSESAARRKEKRKHQNAKLLQCIKDGKVETHLLGVYRNTIASERHKMFHSNVASERNQLKHVSWFGPIDDEEQQEEIYDYCLQLFKSACQYKETFDLVAYMFEVWVPEAVVRAISRVRRLSMSQAEETFAKGVKWSKAEKEEARKELSGFTLTDEDRHEHRERMADSLRIAGLEENVIEALDL